MEIQEIKAYMKANKITYDELAERSQLSISTIKKIFSGISRYPRIDTMQTIERALGLEEKEKRPPSDMTESEKELFDLITQMNEEEIDELSNFIDYLLSKRK